MHDIPVIVGAKRTPIGAFCGCLADFTAPELAAVVLENVISSAGLHVNQISEVVLGCVLTAGLGQAPARQALIRAGLPDSIPAAVVNKVCGSSMKAVINAAMRVQLEQDALVLAGGMESMSNAPHLLPGSRKGYRIGHASIKDHMFTDGLEDAQSGDSMGLFAEQTADDFGFDRAVQDAFALRSLSLATYAEDHALFANEIVPVSKKLKGGAFEKIVQDELPLKAKPEKIPLLKPAFKTDGTVTAANSSGISDGAAVLAITSQSHAYDHDYSILAEIKGYVEYSQQPEKFTTAPIGAMTKLMDTLGWSVDDVDLFEINEAFSVVTLAAMDALSIPEDRVNVHGGACALGHPIGVSGARIIVTLISALRHRGLMRGIAAVCIGGGEAIAVAVEIPLEEDDL